MKKLKSQEEEEAKKKRNKVIVGFVLIFLMAFSTAGFALYGIGTDPNELPEAESENPFYNGQYWQYDIAGQSFYFTQKPEDIEGVRINLGRNIQDFAGKRMYIDSDNEQAVALLSLNLARYSPRMQKGCYGSCEEDLPEKTCEGEDLLIVFRTSEENIVREESNCVFIEGNLESVDAFNYHILGIQ